VEGKGREWGMAREENGESCCLQADPQVAIRFLLTPALFALPRPSGTAVFPTSDDDWNSPQIFAAVRRATLNALPTLPSLAHEEVSHYFPEGRLNTELVSSTTAIVFFTRDDDACKACQEVRIQQKGGNPDLYRAGYYAVPLSHAQSTLRLAFITPSWTNAYASCSTGFSPRQSSVSSVRLEAPAWTK
jgi:hypothetical protein